MPIKTHHYSNQDITITWKPDSCIHSTLCWKGLIEVFNPGKRPWINMDGATTERIIEQVRKCPSGALSYQYLKNQSTNNVTGEAASMLSVQVLPDGPLLIQTACTIQHSDGSVEEKKGSTALCRCGASGNKPYCDGSHRKAGFKG